MEIDDEDYEIPSPSGDSEYSESTGWTEKSSEDDKDDEDEEDRKPRKSERKDNKKDGIKKFKGSTAKNVQKKRARRRCPLKGCKADVIDIPRHLREVHDWSKEMARKATSRYGMRKSFEPKPVKNKKSESNEGKKICNDYHRHRACPIQGCQSVVKSLSNHIRQGHRDIPVGSQFYKKILREARSAKTWKPSEQVKRFRTEEETKVKKCSLAESEDEVEVQTNNTCGVLANMTLEEYKAAKRVDDSMVISVKEHKTADTHGPARVVLSLSLFSYLRLYVSEMRSQVEDSTSEECGSDKSRVFLSWNGCKLESGQISTAINAA